MLDPKLLEILACPVCRNAVVADEDHRWILCGHCSIRYRVEGDIPIMLPEEAEAIPGSKPEQE